MPYSSIFDGSDFGIRPTNVPQLGPRPSKGRRGVRAATRNSPTHPSLIQIASSPLLLWTIVITYWTSYEIPVRRVDLYESILRILVQTWDTARDINRESHYDRLSVRERLRFLETLALAVHKKGPGRSLTTEEAVDVIARLQHQSKSLAVQSELHSVLRDIAERTGILTVDPEDMWRFSHLSFQEFLAAQAILEEVDPLETLASHITELWWREVATLALSSAARRSRSMVEESLRGFIAVSCGHAPP